MAYTTRQHLMRIGQLSVSKLPLSELTDALLQFLLVKRDKITWFEGIVRFVRWIVAGMPVDNPPHPIFVFGNDKINSKKFALFSALPIVTCPGLGECAGWCYSLKCWRYPAPFFRQLMNTLLLLSRDGRRAIQDAFVALPNNIKLRLYVDGDIDSKATVVWWMSVLKLRPDVRAYGYSKSWRELADADDFFKMTGTKWPKNYKLNLSSGGKDENNESLRMRMMSLPIYRGDFIGQPTKFRGQARYSNPQYKKELREGFKKVDARTPFICPGKCGDCIPSGDHACGSDDFDGIPILIGHH